MERGGIDAAELTFVYAESRHQCLDRCLVVEEVQLLIAGSTESSQWLPLAGKDHPQDIHFTWQFSVAGKIDARGLEEPDPILVLEVFGGDGEQARQQRRPQHAAVRLKRVAQSDQSGQIDRMNTD